MATTPATGPDLFHLEQRAETMSDNTETPAVEPDLVDPAPAEADTETTPEQGSETPAADTPTEDAPRPENAEPAEVVQHPGVTLDDPAAEVASRTAETEANDPPENVFRHELVVLEREVGLVPSKEFHERNAVKVREAAHKAGLRLTGEISHTSKKLADKASVRYTYKATAVPSKGAEYDVATLPVNPALYAD